MRTQHDFGLDPLTWIPDKEDQARLEAGIAAVRTNTKVLLITNQDTDRGADRTDGRNAVTAPQEDLPWARHVGTFQNRNTLRDSAINHVEQNLDAAGHPTSPVHAEAGELVARTATR